MSLLAELIEPDVGTELRSGTTNPAQWLIDWVHGGSETSSGVGVNESKALKFTPFWSAVRIISGTIGSLPFIAYRRKDDGGKERILNHPVYQLLHNRPNEYMDSLTFIETRQAHVLTYGNGYAEIQRNGAGKPIALWPLLPDRTFRKISEGGIPYYEVRPEKGETVFLPDYNVLHIKGLGFDGYTGYNVVQYHKEAIGYGIATKEYGSRFFGNSANPGGVLEYPQTLSEKAAKNLKDSWNKKQSGLSKAHRVTILEEGLKWHQIGVDPENAQALETQKYNVDDCSRIFNIPPHKLGSMDKATFSNIEEQNIDFVTSTMLYWFRKWELECNYKLFMPSDRASMFCEILVDALLRGNIKSRYEAYRIGRSSGFLSINDIREKENMNQIGPAGDGYLEPLNMKPADTVTPQKPSKEKALPEETKSLTIQQGFYNLIKSQWSRVVHKQINTYQQHAQEGYFLRMRDYALTILTEPINAYASFCEIDLGASRNILGDVIVNNINSKTELQDTDIARLTNLMMDRIGDNQNG